MQIDEEHQTMLDELKSVGFGHMFEYMIANEKSWDPNDKVLRTELRGLKVVGTLARLGLVSDLDLGSTISDSLSKIQNWFVEAMGYKPRCSLSYSDMNYDLVNYLKQLISLDDYTSRLEEMSKPYLEEQGSFDGQFEEVLYHFSCKVLLEELGFTDGR